jgi:hypothetical protein
MSTVYVSPSTAVKLLLLPFHTVISPIANPVTVSLNWAVTVNGELFVGFGAEVLRVTVGTVESIFRSLALISYDIFPKVSSHLKHTYFPLFVSVENVSAVLLI